MAEMILSKFDVSIEDVFNDESESGSDVVLSDSKVSYATTWVHESTSNDEQLTFDVSSPNRNQIIRVKLIVTITD